MSGEPASRRPATSTQHGWKALPTSRVHGLKEAGYRGPGPPTVDALTVMHGGASLAFALAVHGSAAVYGVVLAAALLRPQKVTS